MVGSLVRWFGRPSRGARAGREARVPRRFVPGVERLETRALPGGLSFGVLASGRHDAAAALTAGAASHVLPSGSKPGGTGDGILSGVAIIIARNAGEEIPQ